mmetsp:Transcript_18554/g.37537  ORF Transcript_18554/g.37537 Transcript_18554/m.37537 type:complete len:525 (+) Transcript_18554:137-1711(+)
MQIFHSSSHSSTLLISSVIVGRRFGKGRSDLITGHLVATNLEVKHVAGSGVEGDVVLLLSHEEAGGVDSNLKFRGNAEEARANELLHPVPGKLEGQQVVVAVGLGLGPALGHDIPAVVQLALLLLKVQLHPVVHARHLSVLDFTNEDVLKAAGVLLAASSPVHLEPDLVEELLKLSKVRGDVRVLAVGKQVLMAVLHGGSLKDRLQEGIHLPAFLGSDLLGLSRVALVVVEKGDEGPVGWALEGLSVHPGEEGLICMIPLPVGLLALLHVDRVVSVRGQTVDVQVPHLLHSVTQADIQVEGLLQVVLLGQEAGHLEVVHHNVDATEQSYVGLPVGTEAVDSRLECGIPHGHQRVLRRDVGLEEGLEAGLLLMVDREVREDVLEERLRLLCVVLGLALGHLGHHAGGLKRMDQSGDGPQNRHVLIVIALIGKELTTETEGRQPQPHELVGRRVQGSEVLHESTGLFGRDVSVRVDLAVKGFHLSVHTFRIVSHTSRLRRHGDRMKRLIRSLKDGQLGIPSYEQGT